MKHIRFGKEDKAKKNLKNNFYTIKPSILSTIQHRELYVTHTWYRYFKHGLIFDFVFCFLDIKKSASRNVYDTKMSEH